MHTFKLSFFVTAEQVASVYNNAKFNYRRLNSTQPLNHETGRAIMLLNSTDHHDWKPLLQDIINDAQLNEQQLFFASRNERDIAEWAAKYLAPKYSEVLLWKKKLR